jgi:pyruvate formate lyase activating enzyme
MFKGWVRTSLIDYPEHIAAILFCGGCSFRCPMCHNASLVLEPGKHASINPQEILAFLQKRAGMVNGVVLSGGEPTLHPELKDWILKLREMGLDIKLDTSGYHPEVLRDLLQEKLLDYIAMDIKAPPDKYARLSGVKDIDLERIKESIRLLRNSALPYEFRTTVVPGLLDAEDIQQIADWLEGSLHYILQQFRPAETLDPELRHFQPYTVAYLQNTLKRIEGKFKKISLRGV